MCPNCDEKLDDPDSCDFCRWESGDPLNDSDHLGEDEIPEASRGATANYDQGLLDFLARALGTGRYAQITNLAVSYNDFVGEAYRKQRRKVAALIRSHVKKLVDDGLLPPGHKVTIVWHYETGVPTAGLDPPCPTTPPQANQLHYQHEEVLRSKGTKKPKKTARQGNPWTGDEESTLLRLFKDGKGVDEISKALGRTPNAVNTRLHHLTGDVSRSQGTKKSEKAAEKAAKAKRQEEEWKEVKGCLPVLAVGIAIVGVGLVLHGCETRANLDDANRNGAFLERVNSDEDTIWPDGFDPVAAGVIFED